MMTDFTAGKKPILYEVVKDGFRYITTDAPDGTEESTAEYRRADLPPTDAQLMADVRVKALVESAAMVFLHGSIQRDCADREFQLPLWVSEDLRAALAQIKGSKG
jgi:hypothetical protein